MTFAFQAFSRLRCCTGETGQSMITTEPAWLFDQPGDLVDLAFADIRRRPNVGERHQPRLDDVEIDGAREADGLFEARLGRARICVAPRAARSSQIRLDDDRAAGLRPAVVGLRRSAR